MVGLSNPDRSGQNLGNVMDRPWNTMGLHWIFDGFVSNGLDFKANVTLYWKKTKFLMSLKCSPPKISPNII